MSQYHHPERRSARTYKGADVALNKISWFMPGPTFNGSVKRVKLNDACQCWAVVDEFARSPPLQNRFRFFFFLLKRMTAIEASACVRKQDPFHRTYFWVFFFPCLSRSPDSCFVLHIPEDRFFFVFFFGLSFFLLFPPTHPRRRFPQPPPSPRPHAASSRISAAPTLPRAGRRHPAPRIRQMALHALLQAMEWSLLFLHSATNPSPLPPPPTCVLPRLIPLETKRRFARLSICFNALFRCRGYKPDTCQPSFHATGDESITSIRPSCGNILISLW